MLYCRCCCFCCIPMVLFRRRMRLVAVVEVLLICCACSLTAGLAVLVVPLVLTVLLSLTSATSDVSSEVCFPAIIDLRGEVCSSDWLLSVEAILLLLLLLPLLLWLLRENIFGIKDERKLVRLLIDLDCSSSEAKIAVQEGRLLGSASQHCCINVARSFGTSLGMLGRKPPITTLSIYAALPIPSKGVSPVTICQRMIPKL
mmetsp:Transcript_10301/g.14185  ORF Transcript_10301/g.14185 Transcript_10301/m.14185 type:complete len:201 (-) Transcript_10301:866-1468(-)